MKAISILQPWAGMIALGRKRVETRSWATPYRGPLAIHASLGRREAVAYQAEERRQGLTPTVFHFGAIVAVVHLAGIARTEAIAGQLSRLELGLGDYTPGRYGWILEDLIALPEPVPCRGALGLWEVPEKIDDVVSLAVFNEMQPRSL